MPPARVAVFGRSMHLICSVRGRDWRLASRTRGNGHCAARMWRNCGDGVAGTHISARAGCVEVVRWCQEMVRPQAHFASRKVGRLTASTPFIMPNVTPFLVIWALYGHLTSCPPCMNPGLSHPHPQRGVSGVRVPSVALPYGPARPPPPSPEQCSLFFFFSLNTGVNGSGGAWGGGWGVPVGMLPAHPGEGGDVMSWGLCGVDKPFNGRIMGVGGFGA